MIDTVHLYMLNFCGHNCPMCCNKLYDIDKLPCITNEILSQIHTLCLTGGDPFNIMTLGDFVYKVRSQFPNIKNVYAYTSGSELWFYLTSGQKWSINRLKLDGLTIAPKNHTDWKRLKWALREFPKFFSNIPSIRLMIFDSQGMNMLKYIPVSTIQEFNIQVLGRRWDREFKTPDNEGFYRLPILF